MVQSGHAWRHCQRLQSRVSEFFCHADRSLYAVHPIPLSDVRAVRPHTPPLRQHTVTLVLHSGLTMPPFYFLQGGVKTFLSVLKQHVNLLPSADTPGAFLVNDLADPLQRSLTSLQLADALPAPMVRQRDGAPSWPLAQWQLEEVSSDGDDAPGVREQLRELVDKFQKVAQGAKDAASSFLAGSVMLGGAPLSEHLAQVGRATVAAAGGDVDVEISENDAHDSIGVSQREASPFLSGEDVGGPIAVPEPRSPSADGEGASLATSPSFASAGWELIDRSVSSELAASPVWAHPRPPPLTSEELAAMIDSEGRLIDQAGLRTRAFYGGIDPPARPQVWKWLLGVDGLDSSAAQREAAVVERRERYVALRRQWESIGADQASRFGKWRERKSRVDKDVHRTGEDRGPKPPFPPCHSCHQ